MLDTVRILDAEWVDYELLDSGERQKLERFGHCMVIRPEPKAWWSPLRPDLWDRAHARFVDKGSNDSHWEFSGKFSPPVLEYGKIKFSTKFMDGSKHLGVFPEQKPHWEDIDEKLAGFVPYSERGMEINRPRVLNLFGYTGGASLVAAEAGAFVTHVDASKPSVDWARKNQNISGLPSDSIRWILDDALKFVRREERRGARYEAIILDPPAFGRGPRGELWKLEKMLPELLASCSNLLSSKPMFVLMTLYSIEASSLMAANMIRQYFSRRIKPVVECGELVLKPTGNGLVLPLSIWAKADF